MPQLNRDILREVFYEIIKKNESFKNIDKFMLAGKEPFQLVLDCCKKAKSAVICDIDIVAQFPNVQYTKRVINSESDCDEEDDNGGKLFLEQKFVII